MFGLMTVEALQRQEEAQSLRLGKSAGGTPAHAAAEAHHRAMMEKPRTHEDDGDDEQDADGQEDMAASDDGDSAPDDDSTEKAAGRHLGTGRFTGELAAGYPASPDPAAAAAGVAATRLGGPPVVAPSRYTDVATVSGAGPIASSIAMNQATARVGLIDAASAASPGLAAQLGTRAPSASPLRPGFHTAPSGTQPPAPRGSGAAALLPPGGGR